LENHSNYLEKEFDLLADKINNKNIANEAKWGDSYGKVVEVKRIVDETVKSLKNEKLLKKAVFQNVDSFYIISCDDDIDPQLLDINKTEYELWRKEFQVNQSLTEVEKELLMINIKSIRNSLCNEYFNMVERLDYKFPCIMPIVKTESSELKVGQTFRAEVLIAAFDPFTKAICEINGNEIQMKDGKWYFEFPCEKIGVKTWKANIQMLGPDDYMFETSVEGRFLIK